MHLPAYLLAIESHLIHTHSRILLWFSKSKEVKSYRPNDEGWTIFEILEHIALTSHYLLILIKKGADKALRNIHDLNLTEELNGFEGDLNKLDRIGIHKSFTWVRPEHMEPTGEKPELEIKANLIEQLRLCLGYLDSLKGGEGLLYKTTMSVDNLGKINVYEYIFFLSQHADRHIAQMEENKREFEKHAT